MLQVEPTQPSGTSTPSPSCHEAPDWAVTAVDDAEPETCRTNVGLETTIRRGPLFSLVSARISNARQMDATLLREMTKQTYRAIFDAIGARHLIRVWNFIPGLLDPVGSSPQRYMVFNAGRHDAFGQRFNGRQEFPSVVPTASGVGTSGTDLEIHALASEVLGTALANPRQIDSFSYSQEYGWPPPCFARATAVTWPGAAAERLLVGGTAAVRGEKTVFEDSLEGQTEETFKNLAAVVGAGLGNHGLDVEDDFVRKDLLARFRHIRTYYTQPESLEAIAASTARVFPNAEPIELARAELCREDLLIEIEGWADLG
ncbi:MAG: hypothetical protein ABFS37_03460 [Acidobacteriota bacterium]